MEGKAGLAEGVLHGLAAEQVDVEVGDGFAAILAVVDDQAEAGFFLIEQVELCGDVAGDEEEVAEEVGVLVFGAADARDGFFWNDEDVDGSLWVDVVEGEGFVGFVDDGGGDFAGDDFLKDGHGWVGRVLPLIWGESSGESSGNRNRERRGVHACSAVGAEEEEDFAVEEVTILAPMMGAAQNFDAGFESEKLDVGDAVFLQE